MGWAHPPFTGSTRKSALRNWRTRLEVSAMGPSAPPFPRHPETSPEDSNPAAVYSSSAKLGWNVIYTGTQVLGFYKFIHLYNLIPYDNRATWVLWKDSCPLRVSELNFNHHFDFFISYSVHFIESHVDRIIDYFFVSESFTQHKFWGCSSNVWWLYHELFLMGIQVPSRFQVIIRKAMNNVG